jgi:hypothetical protein
MFLCLIFQQSKYTVKKDGEPCNADYLQSYIAKQEGSGDWKALRRDVTKSGQSTVLTASRGSRLSECVDFLFIRHGSLF